MEWLIEVGFDFGVMFYGIEVLGVLWIEKGYVIVNEFIG